MAAVTCCCHTWCGTDTPRSAVQLTNTVKVHFDWTSLLSRACLTRPWVAMTAAAHVRLCCLQVIDEVTGGLEGWASKNRWEDLGIVQQVQQHKELQWVY